MDRRFIFEGGIYGVIEGWKSAANSNYKVRFNSIMNSFSKRGSALGNSLGVIGKSFIFLNILNFILIM